MNNMAEKHFKLSTFVQIDPQTAFLFLSDLNNHRHLHPFFVKADIVSSGVDDAGNNFQDFMVTESPRLGPFRYTIHFPTRIIFTGEHEFTSEVHAAMGTHLVNKMICKAKNNGTRITESVTIHAPRITIGYVRQQAYIAHKRTFDLLPSVLTKKRP